MVVTHCYYPLNNLKESSIQIKENFNIEINDNWTTEGSINCINDVEYVKGLLDLGINRVSFGIQTFKESIRKE